MVYETTEIQFVLHIVNVVTISNTILDPEVEEEEEENVAPNTQKVEKDLVEKYVLIQDRLYLCFGPTFWMVHI